MKIIVGLGNPGLKYRNTRHNAGFLVIKELAAANGISLRKKAFGGLYGIGRVKEREVMLFEPLTYMNLSGEAVKAVCDSKLEEREDLLVVSDDLNIHLGSVRLREKGSAGGHNGLRSIMDHMGSDFARLRVGVGSGPVVEDMSGYVLSAFCKKERPFLEEGVQKAVLCVETWLTEGIKPAMARFNERSSGSKG
jgi:peptidyl-tRNA hydrolase, PTH1 family